VRERERERDLRHVGGVSVFRFGSVTSNYYYNYLHDAAAQSRRTLKALLLFTDKIFFSLSFKIHRPLRLLVLLQLLLRVLGLFF